MDNILYLFLSIIVFIIVFIINGQLIGSIQGFTKTLKKQTEGLLLLILGIVFEIILKVYITEWSFEILPVVILLTIFTCSIASGTLALVAAIIFYFSYFGFDFKLVPILLGMFVIVFVNLLNTKFKLKNSKLIWISLIIYELANIVTLILLWRFGDWTWKYLFSYLVPGVVIFVTSYAIHKYITNFLDSVNQLYQNLIYEVGIYYRSAKAIKAINEFSYKNHVEFAITGLMEFELIPEKKSNPKLPAEVINQNKLKLLTVLEKNLAKHSKVLFKANEKHFGFFVPIYDQKFTNCNYLEHPWFKDFLKNINNINSNFYHLGYQYKMKSFFGLSVYGIDDGDINRIISNCEFALKEKRSRDNKRIIFSNFELYQEYMNDGVKIGKLNQLVKIKNIYPSFFNIYNYEKNKMMFLIGSPTIDVLVGSQNKFNQLMKTSGLWSVYIRYVALQAIKIYVKSGSEQKLAFVYDPSLFSPKSSFNVEKFLKKIISHNLMPEKIIIILDSCYEHPDEFFLTQINLLKRARVTFALNNVGTKKTNLNLIFAIKPKYLILSDDIFRTSMNQDEIGDYINTYFELAKKIGATIVYDNIESFTDLKRSLYNRVMNIGGPLFDGESFLPKELSTKSKLYVSEILEAKT